MTQRAEIGERLREIAPGVHLFDTRYLRPGHTATFIVIDDGHAAFVDCGVSANVPDLLAALDHLGVAPDAVDWMIATHVHLDHAGGAGTLMKALPRARLAVHPSGAPHLIDPGKLEQGVRAIYGDDFFDREYAPLEAVDGERVIETPDAAAITLAGRELRIIHTPGHAWHHQSILDDSTGTLIAGDAFGVSYDEQGGGDDRLVMPVVPPPQFKPEVYKASVNRIVDLQPERVALTHFGVIDDVARVGADLYRLVDVIVEAGWRCGSIEELNEALVTTYEQELARRDQAMDGATLRRLFGADIWLTAEGIWLWRQKEEQRAVEKTGGAQS